MNTTKFQSSKICVESFEIERKNLLERAGGEIQYFHNRGDALPVKWLLNLDLESFEAIWNARLASVRSFQSNDMQGRTDPEDHRKIIIPASWFGELKAEYFIRRNLIRSCEHLQAVTYTVSPDLGDPTDGMPVMGEDFGQFISEEDQAFVDESGLVTPTRNSRLNVCYGSLQDADDDDSIPCVLPVPKIGRPIDPDCDLVVGLEDFFSSANFWEATLAVPPAVAVRKHVQKLKTINRRLRLPTNIEGYAILAAVNAGLPILWGANCRPNHSFVETSPNGAFIQLPREWYTSNCL